MVVNVAKISQKMKNKWNKNFLSEEKNIIEWEKRKYLEILKVYIKIDKKS